MRTSQLHSAGREAPTLARGMRFLLYCHDTFGLGHLRRVLALAEHFTTTLPDAEVLIVTGSPVAHAFTLPPRVDYIKLPAVTKQDDGTYRARSLNMEGTAIRDLRAKLLCEVAQSYHPDVFLVDHAPQGWKGEVMLTLAMLRATQPECLRVLGLRDIIDASPIIRQTWMHEGVYSTLEQGYDLILVYGSQKFYDVGKEYALPPTVSQRIRYCGYLDRISITHMTDEAKSEEPTTHPLQNETDPEAAPQVVLTSGGGGDGFPLMRAYLLGLQQRPSLSLNSVLLTGPLMCAAEQRELHQLADTLPAGTVRIESFLPDPLPLLYAADLVVSMAGYNTTTELLGMGQRMLLVPRTTPRQEQLVRASLLAQHGLAQVLYPEQMTPEHLLDSVQQALTRPRIQRRQLANAGISFDGQAMATQAIVDGLRDVLDRLRIDDRNRAIAYVS